MSIIVEDLSVSLKNNLILKNITLVIETGELLSVIGPNGSGKSTLMKTIVGDITPDAGSITYANMPLENINYRERSRIRSVMSQSPSILYDFSVLDIIEMGWLNNKVEMDPKGFSSALEFVVSECKLANLTSRKYNSLSGGEQRRVHLARTLIQLHNDKNNSFSGKYMFFDEPTANLDIAYEINMLKIIRKRASEGFGVLINLHNLEMAYNFSDKIAMLDQGRLIKFGKPESVFDNKLLSQVYGIKIRFDKNIKKLKYYEGEKFEE